MPPGMFYDREGQPIDLMTWGTLREKDSTYFRVAEDRLSDGRWVSTVWLGIDHRFGDDGPPLIFETMVFGDGFEEELCWRYSTEAEAKDGHAAVLGGQRVERVSPQQHHLIIEPDGDADEIVWHIEHPPDCPLDPDLRGVGLHDCPFDWELSVAGVDAINDGDLPGIPGRYPIEHWHEIHHGFEWTEHSSGIRVGTIEGLD